MRSRSAIDHKPFRPGVEIRETHVSHGKRLAILIASSVLALAVLASSQISPGPLSRAHSSLNGATNCTRCHKLAAGEATFRCLDCHGEIAARVSARKGLHATYNLKPGSSQECVRCHSDHNGEDFPLIKWNPKAFDHKQTGYILEGKHAAAECSRCHTAAHIAAPEKLTIKISNLNRSFLGLSQSCASCHEDKHKGRLGADCLQCHNYNDWKTVDVKKFDHSKTRYPLAGLHSDVSCQKCHTPGQDNQPRYAGIPFGKCSDCHADPHRGSFPQGCQTCHNTSGWKRVSTAGVSQNFDHSRTKYPLEGKHTGVECVQCHAGGDFKKPLAFNKCMDCHKDAHMGQFAKRTDGGECASCHTVDGFKPAKFGLNEHAATAYPLQAKHAEVKCDQCHIPKGRETQFKINFQHCTDCHADKHDAQFAAAPYFNGCEKCHTLEGYRPSTFTLARHKESQFPLTGGHIATPCGDCHKLSQELKPVPTAVYRWNNLTCTSCHEDPHQGQFRDRMLKASNRKPGCEACHSTKAWRELTGFDHSQTDFPLLGSHKATACIDCHKPPNLETRLLHVNFKTAPKKCEECHEDPHGKQFAKSGITACIDCHNSTKWKPSLFDHDKLTRFPLQGVHRNVRCEACHKGVRLVEAKSILFYKPTPTECAACHGPEFKPATKRQ